MASSTSTCSTRSGSGEGPQMSFPSMYELWRPRRSGIREACDLLSKAVNQFIDDDCTTMAAALAYYTTFSVAPLLLIVVSIVGMLFGREAVQHQIQVQIQGLIGPGAASQVGAMVRDAGRNSSHGAMSAVLGVAALLIGATGAFTQL